MLFDQIDRQIIINYKGSRWNKPMIVTKYEMAKSCSSLRKEINKKLSFFWLVLK